MGLTARSPCTFPSPWGHSKTGKRDLRGCTHKSQSKGSRLLPRYPNLAAEWLEGGGRRRREEEGHRALPSVTLPLVPQSGDVERTGGLWRLAHGDTGASGGGPEEAGVLSLKGGTGKRKAGMEQCGSLGRCPSQGGKRGGRVSAGGEARGAGDGTGEGCWGGGRGVRPGAGRGLTCSKAQLSATRLALRSSSGSGRPRRAPVPGSSPAGQPRLRLAAGGSIRPSRPGDAAPLRLFTTMKPSPRPLPPQPEPRPRRPTSPSPLAAFADPPPRSHCSFGTRHVSLSSATQ